MRLYVSSVEEGGLRGLTCRSAARPLRRVRCNEGLGGILQEHWQATHFFVNRVCSRVLEARRWSMGTEPEDAHSRCHTGTHPGRCVFDDHAVDWIYAHLVSCVQEDVWSWFGSTDIGHAEDSVDEYRKQSRCPQGKTYLVVASARCHAVRDTNSVKHFRHARNWRDLLH